MTGSAFARSRKTTSRFCAGSTPRHGRTRWIVEKDGEPIGRLYIDRREDEHRLIDIALLPEWRGKGVGSELMRGVLDEAREAGKLVRIHVEQNNPAMRLYKRLGFEEIEDQGVYRLMEWRP